MDSNLQLMLYLIPTLLGFLLILPFGRSLVTPLTEKYPSLASERGRVFSVLLITCLAGMAVSFQTLWISSKISEGGNFCVMTSSEIRSTTPTLFLGFHGAELVHLSSVFFCIWCIHLLKNQTQIGFLPTLNTELTLLLQASL